MCLHIELLHRNRGDFPHGVSPLFLIQLQIGGLGTGRYTGITSGYCAKVGGTCSRNVQSNMYGGAFGMPLRSILVSLLALSVPLFGVAQTRDISPEPDVYEGVMTLEFGYVTDAHGQKVDVTGVEIPYRAERIQAYEARLAKFLNLAPVRRTETMQPRFESRSDDGGNFGLAGANTTVYRNDNGNGTYFFTPEMPSALDDLLLTSAGNNAIWKELTIGMDINYSTLFLIRWIGWNSFTPQGPGVSAFSNQLFDFGGGYIPGPPGQYKVTFDLTNAPLASTPNGRVYFAQQFREYNATGTGQFLDSQVSPVFSGGGVTVGSSEDIFYYDYDGGGPDGIYAENEVDFFDGPPNHANFLLQIVVGGTSHLVKPASFTPFRGQVTGGNLASLWFSDNNYLRMIPGIVMNVDEASIQLVVESFAPSSNIQSMRLDVESAANLNGLSQTIQFWNFATNAWVNIRTDPITQTDTTFQALAPGNPSQFVHPTENTVRARIQVKPAGVILFFPYEVRFDRTEWTIVTP